MHMQLEIAMQFH